jgi:hypothetical protein
VGNSNGLPISTLLDESVQQDWQIRVVGELPSRTKNTRRQMSTVKPAMERTLTSFTVEVKDVYSGNGNATPLIT